MQEILEPYHLYIAIVIFVAVYAVIATEILHKTAIAVLGGALMLVLGVISQGEAFHVANFEQVDVVQLEYLVAQPGEKEFPDKPLDQYGHVYLEVAKKKEVPFSFALGKESKDDWDVKFVKKSPITHAYFEVSPSKRARLAEVEGFIDELREFPTEGEAIKWVKGKVKSFWRFDREGEPRYVPTHVTYFLELGDGRRVKFQVNRILSIAGYRRMLNMKDVKETGEAVTGVNSKGEVETLEPHFVEVVDWNVIFLLAGMMIIVGIMKRSGIFQYIAIRSAQVAKGKPLAILLIMSFVTAVLSAFLDNVTTVVLTAPVTITIARNLKINPIPLLIAQILASNIGGTATLIGDPPNIMIGSATIGTGHELGFLEFIVELTPVVVVIFAVFLGMCAIIWRKAFHVTDEDRRKVMEMKAENAITDKLLLKKSLLVLGVVIIGFFFHGMLHLHPASIALFGAGLLFVITRPNMEHVFHEVEWPTLFFFMGLFILVGALQRVGAIAWVADHIRILAKNQLSLSCYLILWGSALFSAIVDNIPFVATMIPVVKQIGAEITATSPDLSFAQVMDGLWWSLSLGACLGGNGTAIGASANVVTIGIAEKEGYHISFTYFLKFGIPTMIMSVIISHIYIWLVYIPH